MANPEKENGLCVCLGYILLVIFRWVPLEHQSEVTMESPLEVIEAGENTINMADPFTCNKIILFFTAL
jgi:hypothetical protein